MCLTAVWFISLYYGCVTLDKLVDLTEPWAPPFSVEWGVPQSYWEDGIKAWKIFVKFVAFSEMLTQKKIKLNKMYRPSH